MILTPAADTHGQKLRSLIVIIVAFITGLSLPAIAQLAVRVLCNR